MGGHSGGGNPVGGNTAGGNIGGDDTAGGNTGEGETLVTAGGYDLCLIQWGVRSVGEIPPPDEW